jgi:hypothetical protein
MFSYGLSYVSILFLYDNRIYVFFIKFCKLQIIFYIFFYCPNQDLSRYLGPN